MTLSLKTRFMATLGLVLAFTFSCSDDGDDTPPPSVSSSGGGSSSSSITSSENGSSSSEPECYEISSLPTTCGGSSYDVSTQYCSNGTVKSYGYVPDDNGKVYKTVEIGPQTWMAENLDYAVEGSRCYPYNTDSDNYGNCARYGRLYNWAAAMNLSSSYNSSYYNQPSLSPPNTKYRGVCPSGWHIPNNSEWITLMTSVGGSETAGRYLKATTVWSGSYCGLGSSCLYQCEDKYGFAALPGGTSADGIFLNLGTVGSWWASSENSASASTAEEWYMSLKEENMGRVTSSKVYLHSVRCLED